MSRTRPTPTDLEWALIGEVASPELLTAIDALLAAPNLSQEQVFAAGVGMLPNGNAMTRGWFKQSWNRTLRKCRIDRPLRCRVQSLNGKPRELPTYGIVEKSHPRNLTLAEAAKELQVHQDTASKLSIAREGTWTDTYNRKYDLLSISDVTKQKRELLKKRGRKKGVPYEKVAEETGYKIGYVRSIFQPKGPGHPAFGRKRDDGTFKAGRTLGTSSCGRYPLAHPEDVAKLIKYLNDESQVDGFELLEHAWSRTKSAIAKLPAVKELTYTQFRKWTQDGRCPWIGRKLASTINGGPSSDEWIRQRTFVKTEDVNDLIAAIHDSGRAKYAKWPTLQEFAKRLGMHWKTCSRYLPGRRPHPILNHHLNAIRHFSEKGKSVHAPKESWRIDPNDLEMLLAVAAVWMPVKDAANLLDISRTVLTYSCSAKRSRILGRNLSQDDCRKLPADRSFGRGSWHLHARYIAELAKAVGKAHVAGRFTRSANQSEQIAAEALSHWQPEDESQTNGKPDAQAKETTTVAVADPPVTEELRTELRTQKKPRKKLSRHAYDGLATDAASDFKRRSRDAKQKGEILPLSEFCDDFIGEKRLALAHSEMALKGLPTPRTLYDKLRHNRELWDPQGEYGARPRKPR